MVTEIRTVNDYEIAMIEIQELSGAPEGSPEERRLIELVEAAEAWDRAKGGEVAGEETKKGPASAS